MATQSTFLCECGNVVGRMAQSVRWLKWNSEEGDPVMKGLTCGNCKQNWLWVKPEAPQVWVDVQKCCKDFECAC